ncbi:MAG: hypothetical protein EPN39_08565 [Chitinophagaceae bacterium]|nr:MAG: hypothetical protein EPN39_08565 [Chitinophagaceae bacterium]
MAQQYGKVFITGTIHDLCFYKMKGKHYVRMKSSLDRKRVNQDAAFRRTRENAALLGKASRLASMVYRQLPEKMRKRSLYHRMTGQALKLLREERAEEDVLQELKRICRNL